jgi:hypothetical protein
MKHSTRWVKILSILCVLGSLIAPAHARDSILNAVPDDAIALVVVHNLAKTNRSIGQVAKLVNAPVPDLLNKAKSASGIQKGIDEQGDAAMVLASVDPAPNGIFLLPVTSFAEFFAALQVKQPETGAVEVELAGRPMLVGRKGDYAAIARVADRDALEQLLAAKNSLANDSSLAGWIDHNAISAVVTARGIQQLIPKLVAGIAMAQGQIRQAAGENGQAAANALQLYSDFFQAAQTQVNQYGLGLRIDSNQNIELLKRVQFVPGGDWARRVANIRPVEEELLAGLQPGPFVMALGTIVPHDFMRDLMKFSVQIMQDQPGYQLTPEQAQKYVELSIQAMRSVHSMNMRLGIPEPGTGLYGNTSAIMTVDDSKRYIELYAKTLDGLREIAKETESSAIPRATSRHVKIGETEVLAVTMTMPVPKQAASPGAPNPEQIMKLIAGPDQQLTIYIAPTDEHHVLMVYTSRERMKSALEFYRSQRPGLSAQPGVSKVATGLPAGSQFVAFVSLDGAAEIGRRFAAMLPQAGLVQIPELPASPPLGVAVKISGSGVEGHLLITADTLRAVGHVVAARRDATKPPEQQD